MRIHIEASKAASGPGQVCLGPVVDPIELLFTGAKQSVYLARCETSAKISALVCAEFKRS